MNPESASKPDLIPFSVQEDASEIETSPLDPSPLEEGIIYHRTSNGEDDSVRHHFDLLYKIGEFTYWFRLRGGLEGEYELLFSTKEHGIAITNLTPEDRKRLAVIMSSFIEAVGSYRKIITTRIEANPSVSTHTVKDINTCIEKILSHPNNIWTNEELSLLSQDFKHKELFNRYHQLFKSHFFGWGVSEHEGREAARSRLFQDMFKRHLKNWKVVPDPYGHSFALERRT